MKAYYIIRKDLEMSPAKLAVQVGHGTDFIHLKARQCIKDEWLEDNRKKIVLGISTKERLLNLSVRLIEDNINFFMIYDNGLTEFNGKTLTGMVIYPISEDDTPKYIKRLRLYD